jgi:DNA-binding NtrC family response regulator
MQQQPWPGNIRELQNVVRKALILAGQYPVNLDIIHKALSQTNMPRPVTDQTLSTYVSELLSSAERNEIENVETVLMQVVERELYGQAIRLARGDQSRAARWLGVSRPTMREKLIRYGLHPTQHNDPAPPVEKK